MLSLHMRTRKSSAPLSCGLIAINSPTIAGRVGHIIHSRIAASSESDYSESPTCTVSSDLEELYESFYSVNETDEASEGIGRMMVRVQVISMFLKI